MGLNKRGHTPFLDDVEADFVVREMALALGVIEDETDTRRSPLPELALCS